MSGRQEEMIALKPCPFCGDDEPQEMTGDGEDHWVLCGSCGGSSGVEDTAEAAAAAWNRRAEAAEVPE
jgi:Lar family restriction alleviation protein